MRAKASVTVVALLLLVSCLIPRAVNAVGPLTLNPTKGTVGSQVAIPNSCSYGTGGNYYIYWDEANLLVGQGVLASSGCPSLTFTVPEAARGNHKVTLRTVNDSFSRDFTVAPAISLSSSQGTVGTSLTVVGQGFSSNELNIKIVYDANPIEVGIGANSKGGWQKTFKVPAGRGGKHVIDVEGSTTPATEVDDQTFTVSPQISVNPVSGWVGSLVSMAGTGFGSSETNITVTYDGLAVKTGIATDSSGSWQSTFSVPTSAKGDHKINAYGAVTAATSVVNANFAVSPGVKLELTSGALGDAIRVGDNLWISGFGFEENEAGIKVTFDGTQVVGGIIADAKGSWATRLEVPLGVKGEHVFNASGDTTKAGNVAGAKIIISPKIDINPTTSVNIGDNIVVNGTGFGGTQAITIIYDGSQVATGSATDTKGRFTTSFKLTKSRPGAHAITVTDATAAVASVSLTVESTPPPTPRPISPEPGSEVGFVGKTVVAFGWSAVEDPSGVFYVLEISRSADFSGAVLRKEGLTKSQYTLTSQEALAKGDYYWRVRATDSAGNESDWANGQLLRVGVIDLWMLALMVIAGIGIIAGIIWRIVSVTRRSAWK